MIDKLRLDRWFAHHDLNRRTPPPKDYISWAVDLLVAGRDTPSLRILAGLNATLDRGDIEEYFIRTCKELGLESLELSDNPRDAVPFVRRLSRSGTLSPKETLHHMSRLYELSEYSDPQLELWFALKDDRFPEQWKCLEEWIDQEWDLFDRSVGLDLPNGFALMVRCETCRHIGYPARPSILTGLRVLLTQGKIAANTQPLVCANCGDSRLKHMAYAEVQEDYFSRLRGGDEGTRS
jgi:hypothetical protein